MLDGPAGSPSPVSARVGRPLLVPRLAAQQRAGSRGTRGVRRSSETSLRGPIKVRESVSLSWFRSLLNMSALRFTTHGASTTVDTGIAIRPPRMGLVPEHDDCGNSGRRSSELQFRILGPVQVWRNGSEIQLDGSKQRTVLAALLLARGRLVSDTRLSELLWGDDPPKTFAAQIYTYVSRLRKYLADDVEIIRQRPGYLIPAYSAKLDYDEFQRLTRFGRAALTDGRHVQAAAQLTAAQALWRGPALMNVTAFMNDAEFTPLDEARIESLECRIDADLALGHHAELVSELTGLVAQHPLRERFRAQLMSALHRSERQADALRVYFEGRETLSEELGVDPGPMLADAYKKVLLDVDPHQERPAAVTTAGRALVCLRPAMLPPDLPDFTGRIEQTNRLLGLLSPERTGNSRSQRQGHVTGMAGTGKSALAVHVAHLCRNGFPDGQLYVNLRAADDGQVDPAEALAWFLRALGCNPSEVPAALQERVQLYRSLLADQRMLVVLDNASTDEQVRHLLPAGSGCGLLVTSSTPMVQISAEHQVELPLLTADESIAFLSRMSGCQPIDSDRRSAELVIEYCGNLPTALRIAGTRLTGKPHWTFRRMANSLADEPGRLDRLQLGSVAVRQTLLQAFQELERDAQRSLRALSVFHQSVFTARRASLVLGMSEASAEDILESLVDYHWLTVTRGDDAECTGYRLHILVSLFARAMDSFQPVSRLTTVS